MMMMIMMRERERERERLKLKQGKEKQGERERMIDSKFAQASHGNFHLATLCCEFLFSAGRKFSWQSNNDFAKS